MRPFPLPRATLVIACLGTLAACTQFPQLDTRVSPAVANAPAPDLIPLTAIVARANRTETTAPDLVAGLTGRIAALRARAAGLRGPVIPATARANMLRGVR